MLRTVVARQIWSVATAISLIPEDCSTSRCHAPMKPKAIGVSGSCHIFNASPAMQNIMLARTGRCGGELMACSQVDEDLFGVLGSVRLCTAL
jgi:hypothetical protein